MASLEDEVKDLKEKNNELVQKVQYWKMTAAQRENEKLELMKEINELRLKLIRIKTGGAAEARKLDVALQSAGQEAMEHLVQASSAIARTIELTKTYMRDRQELDTVSPRWSSISNSTEKVHRVPPMMGGQSIQPVVSLSRATFNISGARQASRSPNQSRNVSVRALPMHMLQDVYIPLTRIDMRVPASAENDDEGTPADDSGEAFEGEDAAEESQDISEDDDFETSRRLEMVTEDVEPGDEAVTPQRGRADNPLEGPSWLLDGAGSQSAPPRGRGGALEPDSTTHGEPPNNEHTESLIAPEPARMFTPTMRRRKRARSPPAARSPRSPRSPRSQRSHSDAAAEQLNCSRVLQVLVPKMRLDGAGRAPGAPGAPRAGAPGAPGADEAGTPPAAKRAPRFDAPSPNGATDAGVIVSEQPIRRAVIENRPSGETSQPSVRASLEQNVKNETSGYGSRIDGHSSIINGHDSRSDGDEPRSDGHNSIIDGHEPRSDGHSSRNDGPSSRMDGRGSKDGHENERDSKRDSRCRRDSGDSDSGSGADRVSEGRTRRNRKPVTYKEKPLNRKLRRC